MMGVPKQELGNERGVAETHCNASLLGTIREFAAGMPLLRDIGRCGGRLTLLRKLPLREGEIWSVTPSLPPPDLPPLGGGEPWKLKKVGFSFWQSAARAAWRANRQEQCVEGTAP